MMKAQITKILKLIDEIKSDKNKLMAAGIVFAILLIVDFSFLVKAQFSSVKDLGIKVDTVKKQIDDVSRDLVFMQRNQNLVQQFSKVKRMYSSAEIPLLLQEVSAIAKENSIKVKAISSEKVSVVKDKGQQSSNNYISIRIRLDASGGYHNIGVFLNQLENGSQPIFADEIKMYSSADDDTRQEVKLSLRTYVKK